MNLSRAADAVIPALVAGIQPSARFGACGWMDPGHKARDDSGDGLSEPEHTG